MWFKSFIFGRYLFLPFENEIYLCIQVDSEELAAEVLEEVRHLHLDQGLVVDLDDPEVALRLIFP